MKGSEAKLLEYMEGAKKRFVIPVYQRNYDWRKENCKQLYDDLVKVIQTGRRSHFFGSIVSSYQPNGRYTEYLIIDGQQRLTTVSLLLLAMHNLLKEEKIIPETTTMAQEIYEDYLVDKHQPKETRIKLKPVKNDRNAFEKLFDADDENDSQSNLTYNYEYFYNRIQKREITIDQLYDALFALEIINIELTQDDNPQLIFESLNSTGLALSEGDKIRNFILMGLPARFQNDCYEKYWIRIEKCTGYDVSMFIRDFLSVKQQSIPSINKVYIMFKNYVDEEKIETEALLKNMLAYAKRYETLLKGQTSDKAINACIYRLNRLETTVTRTFFLEVLRLHEEGALSIAQVREVFLYTENYLFRRMICDLPTNTLNKLFLILHGEIIRLDGTSNDYVEKFKYVLTSKKERSRFPRDSEFIEAFATRQIYQMNSKNKVYIFERFENYGTVEDKDIYRHIDEGVYSIEHIMPQHLTPSWVANLGSEYEEIHETWLHRIANLTLTGYNSKYSNSSFADKKSMEHGFAQSGLRMNTWIAQRETWGLLELETRSDRLMQQALEIWPMPQTTYVPMEKQQETYTLEDDIDLSGREISRFEYRGTTQPSTSWTDMFEQVLKLLHAEDKRVLANIAYNHTSENDLRAYVSDNPADLRSPLQIDGSTYVEKNTSTNTKLTLLKRFFKAYEVNPEDLTFYLRDQKEEITEDATPRFEVRQKYWAYALKYIRAAHAEDGAFGNVSPSKDNWICGFFGISGCHITCIAKYDQAQVNLNLSKSNKEKNKAAFDYLYARRTEIEQQLGIVAEWNRSDKTKRSYIAYNLSDVSIRCETDWTQMAEFHAKWSKKFYDVLVPYLKEWLATDNT